MPHTDTDARPGIPGYVIGDLIRDWERHWGPLTERRRSRAWSAAADAPTVADARAAIHSALT